METKDIILKGKSGLCDKHSGLCEHKGLIVSKQFGIMADVELKEEGKNG